MNTDNIRIRKMANAIIGFAAGLITLPLAMFAWPIFAAWFFWDETDDDVGKDGDRAE